MPESAAAEPQAVGQLRVYSEGRRYMKTIFNTMGNVIGLMVVVGIGIILVLTLKRTNLQNKQVSTFQSPIEKAVPAPTDTPSLTQFSSPIVTATPKPTSPVTVVPGPLPPGLKIVVAEGFEDEITSVVWVANVDDLTHVQIIKKFSFGRIDLPGGYISPDGTQIAYILPGKSVWEGTLGVMNSDGSDDRIIDRPVFGWGTEHNVKWSHNGQWLAYLKQTFTSPNSTVSKTEIWLADTKTWETNPLATVESADGFIYGWSGDDTRLYYSFNGEMWQVQVDGKSPAIKMFAPVGDALVGNGKLSPDSTKFLYTLRDEKRETRSLYTISLADKSTSRSLAAGIARGDFAFKWYQVNPIWSPDSSAILYNIPVGKDQIEFRVDMWDKSKPSTVIPIPKGYYYLPLSWSPDGQIIIAARRNLKESAGNTFHHILLYLNGKDQEIYKIEPDLIPLNFIGWLDDRKGSVQ